MRSLRAQLLLAALLACGSGATDPYQFTAPPAAPPGGMDPPTWVAHARDDLLPYWTSADARGVPEGNFPTYRGMNGVPIQNRGARKPRMIGRQTFTYAIGYLLTGDESLLDLARAGNRWLLDHARDPRGGWHADLDATGNPLGDGDKTAQDAAYVAMGPAAFYFVARDAEAEAAVLATRDLLFDPAKYWDAGNGRIRDAMDGALSMETYIRTPGSWELVAQLDPVTAFMLLVQPVLTDPARRTQMLGDLRALALRIRESFWKDGIFWGSTGAIGSYGTDHTDFGHMLKAYSALRQIDARLADHPFQAFLAANAAATLTRAYDADFGRWAKRPTSATEVEYGSDWWAYAEADQLAAELALHDPKWIATVATTARHFREDYVDRTRAAREVVPSVRRNGAWVYPWPDTDTAKCNEWKNGFHAAEHALLLSLFGSWLTAAPAQLYFALPADRLGDPVRAYTLDSTVAKVEDLGPLARDPARHKVRVSFDRLR